MEQKPVYKELQIPEKKRKGILFMKKLRKNGIIQKHKKQRKEDIGRKI